MLLDGHVDQLARVRAAAKRHRVTVTIVLDLIHVLEYLWKAAYVFHPEGSSEAEAWVTERRLWLLCGDAGQVIASVRRIATCRGLTAAARKTGGYLCGDLDDYWRHHEQRELECNHAARYANGKIPSLTRPAVPSHRNANRSQHLDSASHRRMISSRLRRLLASRPS